MNWNALLGGLGQGLQKGAASWQEQQQMAATNARALAAQLLAQKQFDLNAGNIINDNMQGASNKIPGGTTLAPTNPFTKWMLTNGQAKNAAPGPSALPINTNPLSVLTQTPSYTAAPLAPGTNSVLAPEGGMPAVNTDLQQAPPMPKTGVYAPQSAPEAFTPPAQYVKLLSEQERKDQAAETGKQDAIAQHVADVKHITTATQLFNAGKGDEAYAELSKVSDPSIAMQGVTAFNKPEPKGPQLSAADSILMAGVKKAHPEYDDAQALSVVEQQRAMNSRVPPVAVPANERPAWTKAYTDASNDLAKTRAPLTTRIEAIDRGLSLIGSGAQGNAMAMSTLIPEFITATAGGMGTGVRITSGEINNSTQARSLREGIIASMQKLQNGQQLTPVQLNQMQEALTSLKASIGDKLALHSEYESKINDAQSPDEIRQLKAQFHKVFTTGAGSALDPNAPPVSAFAGKTTVKGSDGSTWQLVNGIPKKVGG